MTYDQHDLDQAVNHELADVVDLIAKMKDMHQANKSVVSALDFLADCVENKKRDPS